MDLRQAVGSQSWRRVQPSAPPRARAGHSSVHAFHSVNRTAARVALPVACSSAAVGSIVSTTTTAEQAAALFGEEHDHGSRRSAKLAEACSICPAVLQTRLSKAHSSAVSAAIVVQDTHDEKLVVTASLDKGVAAWRFYTAGSSDGAQGSVDESIEVTRLKVPGAPVFSLAKIPDVLPDGTVAKRVPTGKPSGIYLGTAAKEVLTWMLGSKDVTDKIVLGGHTGWVRSLAVTGKWLFSCGCNFLRLWDTTFRTPKESDAVRLFTGDILAIAASQGQVFTAGADGSLRSWTISRGGELEAGPAVDRAHEGRVVACLVAEGRVYTTSYDGCIKAWSANGLQLLAEVRGAHGGEKVLAAALGVNGVLFTGGDDKMVRAWAPTDLAPLGPPLEGHGASVRVLAAGRRGILVSGDADGDVCIWGVCDVVLPQQQQSEAAAALGAAVVAGAHDGLANGCAVGVAVAPPTLQQLEDLFAAPAQPSLAQQQQLLEQQQQQQQQAEDAQQQQLQQAVAEQPVLGAVAAASEVQPPAASVEPWAELPAAAVPVPPEGVAVYDGEVNGHAHAPVPLEEAVPVPPAAVLEPEPAAAVDVAPLAAPQVPHQLHGHVNGHASGYVNGHAAAVAPPAEECDWRQLDGAAAAAASSGAAVESAAAGVTPAAPELPAAISVAPVAPGAAAAPAAAPAPAAVVTALPELEVEDVASAVAVAVLTKEADARAAAAAAAAAVAAAAAAEAEAAAAAAAAAAVAAQAEAASLAALAAQAVAQAEAEASQTVAPVPVQPAAAGAAAVVLEAAAAPGATEAPLSAAPVAEAAGDGAPVPAVVQQPQPPPQQ